MCAFKAWLVLMIKMYFLILISWFWGHHGPEPCGPLVACYLCACVDFLTLACVANNHTLSHPQPQSTHNNSLTLLDGLVTY